MGTLVQRSFVGGELSPSSQGRVDTSKYSSGLKTCRNTIVMRHGGTQNRPGTKLVGEIFPTTDASSIGLESIRLIPFEVDHTNNFDLEFRTFGLNQSKMRVVRDGAYVATSILTITGVTNAIVAVVSAVNTLVNGQEVFISGIKGMVELNFRDLFVANVTGTTFELMDINGAPINSTSFSAYIQDGQAAVIYETIAPVPILDGQSQLLKYTQSANSMILTMGVTPDTLALPFMSPIELRRISDTNWTFTVMTFAPAQVAPTALVITANITAGSSTWRYRVSAINDITGEESLPTAVAASALCGVPTISTPNFINFTAAAGASTYNVYRETFINSGTYGLVFIVTKPGVSYIDIGVTPNGSLGPVIANNPFAGGQSDAPTCSLFFQQRLLFGNSLNFQERIWGSRIGLKNNFGISDNSLDDEALQFDMTSNQVNRIQNMINIGKLIVFTSGSESSIEGNPSGVLTPTSINPKQYTQNGSSYVPPLVVGGNALYIQSRGAIIRDLTFEFQSDSYRGNDLTIFSAHLFEGFTITEWAWQQIPQSIVWAVRNDGVLLGLTYIREQQIWAWHRHDTDGLVKHITVVPENSEDAVYLQIDRTIGGVVHHFHERMNTRVVSSQTISDAIFSDSCITFDYRNKSATQELELLGLGTFTDRDAPFAVQNQNNPTFSPGVPLQLRITGATVNLFLYNPGDVFKVTSANGTIITLTVEKISGASGAIMSVVADKQIPPDLQGGTGTTNWGEAKNKFVGLWHLEGKNVSVLADGFVEGSPNNSDYDIYTVTNGAITFPQYYQVAQIGLPYISDIETLNIDTVSGETLMDKAKSIGRVTVDLEKSRGGFFGAEAPTGSDSLEGLFELKARNQELMQNPVALTTDYADVDLLTEWNSNGRIFIRQTEPLPFSVLAVAPGGFIPLRQ